MKKILLRYVFPIISLILIYIIVQNIGESDQLKNQFFKAVRHSDIRGIKKSQNQGVDINVVDTMGQTALHSAAYKGEPKVIKYLVSLDANIEAKDELRGGTPLHWAMVNGRINNVKTLLKIGANVNSLDNRGMTPMHWAVTALKINDKTKTVNILTLINNGGDPTIRDNTGRDLMDYAKKKKNQVLIDNLENLDPEL